MKLQKRLAGAVLGISTKRVVFDENRLEEITQAITKQDVRNLISSGAIIGLQKKGVSQGRAKKKKAQKAKGRSRGHGSRKGRSTARGENRKTLWVNKIRLQRSFILDLLTRKHIDNDMYRDLYRKSKGGFFRSKRHIELYLEEKGILKGKNEK